MPSNLRTTDPMTVLHFVESETFSIVQLVLRTGRNAVPPAADRNWLTSCPTVNDRIEHLIAGIVGEYRVLWGSCTTRLIR
ncbi:hypothetical protein RHRU231_690004 [Rhodococcus ruber]|uniref:Uncharacterized protein n=1 Tax=Rhodococcus ruber TaxID=1830 RepID=A0A098BPZ4_9NOCA|nr:hypothetical protein RHRU231_690004 [Rhodococcus ruber]